MSASTILNRQSLSLNVFPRHEVIGCRAKTIGPTTQFCASITAASLPCIIRAPVDILVALDVSGSMKRDKLQLCKQTLNLLVREISSKDNFGLVTFSDEATVVFPCQLMTKQAKARAQICIDGLVAKGCTNLSGGIALASQELASQKQINNVRAIFLLTDGIANLGVTDFDDIVTLTKNCIGSLNGDANAIAIHSFGYGSDHDRVMLGALSDVSQGGTYYFVSNDSDVASAFGDALGGVLSVVAQNLVLHLSIPHEASKQGVKIVKVHHTKCSVQQDGTVKVDLGDLYAEELRDIILDVALPTKRSARDDQETMPHVDGFVTYLDVINKTLAKGPTATGSIRMPDHDQVSTPNKHLAVQSLRLTTANIVAKAEKLASDNQLSEAATLIRSHLEVVREFKELALSYPLVDQIGDELRTILTSLKSKEAYTLTGAMFMQTRINTHTTQRSTESSWDHSNAYGSMTKRFISKKMAEQAK